VTKCDPLNQPVEAGVVAHVILHSNSENYVLIESKTGSPLAGIEFGPECALTETSNVKGSLVAECGHLNAVKEFVHLDCKNQQVTQLFRQVPGSSLFPSDKLIYGLSSEALFDGVAAVKLAGTLSGGTWGGHV